MKVDNSLYLIFDLIEFSVNKKSEFFEYLP